MVRRIAVVSGMALVAQAGAQAPASGWVVENQDPDAVSKAAEGSITVTGVAGADADADRISGSAYPLLWGASSHRSRSRASA